MGSMASEQLLMASKQFPETFGVRGDAGLASVRRVLASMAEPCNRPEAPDEE